MACELKDIDFVKIRSLVYEQCGINLHEGKKELVKARLNKRLKQGNFNSFADYYHYVTTDEGVSELVTMIDSLSTNLTSFFREDSHFQKLREIVPNMIGTTNNGRRVSKLRLWSAGCSTGEEPYSIAIVLSEIINGNNRVDMKILATDISTKVLQTAVNSIYPKERIKNIPAHLLKKYFQIGQKDWRGHYRVKKDLRDIVKFKRFNLMEPQPLNEIFDVIFCRNVMIYFDKATQNNLVNRFYNCLKQGAYLFVGHSESLTGLTHRFRYIEPSIYRK
jgi:chemotaxis protein methyltransferase CheR